MTTHKNIIMTPDDKWKVYQFIPYVNLYIPFILTLQFHHTRPCCKDLQQAAKFCDHVHLMFQTSATWNWHTNLQLILFSWSHFCYSTVVYVACLICFIQFIAGHSCLSNNIVNIPVPTLPAYTFFDCQVSTLCLIKLGSWVYHHTERKKKRKNKNKTV